MLTLTLVTALALNGAAQAKKPAKKPEACGKDMKCFIQASHNCGPAKVEHTLSMDMMGMIQNITRTYEVSADATSKCVLLVTTTSMKADASPEAMRNIKKAAPPGTSDADIRKQLDKQNADQAKQLPKPMTCHFAPGFLATVMAKLKDGEWDSRDWDVGCPKTE